MTKRKTLHLRKVRPKRRQAQSVETEQTINQVFTLCGQWTGKAGAIREDRAKDDSLICDECCAQRDLGSIFGE